MMTCLRLFIAFLLAILHVGECFTPEPFVSRPALCVKRPTNPARHHSLILRASGKGFGKVENNNKNASKEPATVAEASETPSAISSKPTPAPAPAMNTGQRALEQMRREQAEKKDAELRQVRELMAADEQVRDGPTAIPEKVAQRMGKRMLPFVGIPFFGGLGTFVAFWYFAVYKDVQFETSLVAAATIAVLVVSLLGITYSVMSASWDPDREGGALGVEEFKTNVKNIQDGLSRSKENLVLREKMAKVPKKQLDAALDDLARREGRSGKGGQP